VPIIFQDRKYGNSKMNKGIIKEGVLGVLKLRWNSMFKNYRQKVKNDGSLEVDPVSKEKILSESK